MKSFNYFLVTLLLCIATVPTGAVIRFTVFNPNQVAVSNAPVVISAASLAGFEAGNRHFVIKVNGTKTVYQADDLNGDGAIDEVVFLVDLAAGEKAGVSMERIRRQPLPVEPQVFASLILKDNQGQWHHVKEASSTRNDMYNQLHHHGVAFESDKMAYRIYFDNKSTIDLYGKKDYRLELRDTWWYPTREQLAAGYGDDILLVSGWVGIGSLKGWNGKMQHIDKFGRRTQRILAGGPLRTVVESEVEDWEYEGGKTKVTVRYILYAGHRDVTAEVRTDRNLKAVATGVQQIGGGELMSSSTLVGSWGSWYPQPDTLTYAKETVGLGLYMPASAGGRQQTDGVNNLILAPVKSDDVLTYYFTTVAAKENKQPIQDAKAFFNYLNEWEKGLQPLQIMRK
jgi:hypothetical protein